MLFVVLIFKTLSHRSIYIGLEYLSKINTHINSKSGTLYSCQPVRTGSPFQHVLRVRIALMVGMMMMIMKVLGAGIPNHVLMEYPCFQTLKMLGKNWALSLTILKNNYQRFFCQAHPCHRSQVHQGIRLGLKAHPVHQHLSWRRRSTRAPGKGRPKLWQLRAVPLLLHWLGPQQPWKIRVPQRQAKRTGPCFIKQITYFQSHCWKVWIWNFMFPFLPLQEQIWDISSDEEGASKVKEHVLPGLTVDMIINALKQLDLSKFLGL